MIAGMNRRHFLQAAAAGATAPLILPARVRAASPNGKLNHAAIGVDGQGWSDLQALAGSNKLNVVAICDVDTSRMEKAAQMFPAARKYQDWRELLNNEGDKIDSVNVTVPDHMHASIAMAAMKKGKHVYCQKPLTHCVSEARALRKVAEETGKVTQMGNQIQSNYEYRAAVQLLQQGVIGKIKAVHAWTPATFPQRGRPAGEDQPPASLNWDRWLGVAPQRPFKNGIYHAFNWRGWMDFGGGPLADFWCHIMDTPFKALELTAPTSVHCIDAPKDWQEKAEWNKENWPDWAVYQYEFPATKYTTGSLPVTWYDGGKQPPANLVAFEEGRKYPGGGSLFLGEGGNLILPHVGTPVLVPFKKMDMPKLDPRNHYTHYVEACLGGERTTSNFTYAGPLTEAGLLGNIACRFPGKKLEWNRDAMQFPNMGEANQYVSPRYRGGWNVPDLG